MQPNELWVIQEWDRSPSGHPDAFIMIHARNHQNHLRAEAQNWDPDWNKRNLEATFLCGVTANQRYIKCFLFSKSNINDLFKPFLSCFVSYPAKSNAQFLCLGQDVLWLRVVVGTLTVPVGFYPLNVNTKVRGQLPQKRPRAEIQLKRACWV